MLINIVFEVGDETYHDQRQELLNTRADLRDAQTQLQICRDQWKEMRKQRDAVMERASLSLIRAEEAERALAGAQHDTAKWRHDCLKARQENAGYVADAEKAAQDCVELSAALANCQHGHAATCEQQWMARAIGAEAAEKQLSTALAHCQHDLRTMENRVEQAETALAARGKS